MGVVIGAASMLGGFILHKLSVYQSQEVSYLHLVPKFTNFRSLKDHLKSSPGQKADVLVEGSVAKLGSAALYSEKAGMEGAARLVTTTMYTKVYHDESGTWRDLSNTIENVNVSLPFKITDNQGEHVRVHSAHRAGGFRQALQRVYQEKTQPEKRSMGDYATTLTLKETPNGSLTREYLLVFGTSLAGYGSAVLQNQSLFSSGEVVFTPSEVGSSIHSLISRNEMIASAYRFISLVLILAGGSILVISVAPLLLNILVPREERRRPAIESS